MIEYGSQAYRRVIYCMSLGSFLLFSNLYLFQPIMPILALDYDLAPTQVNWVFASTTLTLALSLVLWAQVSDAYGRKKIMLLGLYLPVVINIGLLFDDSFRTLLVARALMGIALGAFAAIAMAYMAELLSANALARAIGGYIAANSLGGIAGRLTGGILTDLFSWQFAVVVLSIATFIVALILQKWLPKEQVFLSKKLSFYTLFRELYQHTSNTSVWFAMLIGGLNFALFVNLFSVLGFRLTQAPFSLPTSVTSLIFLCYLTGTVTAKLSANWTERHSAIQGFYLGAGVSILGLLLAYFDSVVVIIASLLLISAGAFFVHALAYAWVGAHAKTGRSTASAFYLVHYYAGGSAGGFLLLKSWTDAGWLGVIASSLILFLGIFILAFLLSKNSNINEMPS